MLPKTEEAFRHYFDQGMSPAQARAYHETELIAYANDSSEVVSKLADAQINPTDRQIYHLHDTWRLANVDIY